MGHRSDEYVANRIGVLVCWGVCVPRGLVRPLPARGAGARGFKHPANPRPVAHEAVPPQVSRCPGVDRQVGGAQGVAGTSAAAQEEAQGVAGTSRRTRFQKPQNLHLTPTFDKTLLLGFRMFRSCAF
jgi:hypothetical protein